MHKVGECACGGNVMADKDTVTCTHCGYRAQLVPATEAHTSHRLTWPKTETPR